MAHILIGALPRVGQVVQLSAAASPAFVERPTDLLVTEAPRVSAADAFAGLRVDQAAWLILSGWVLGKDGSPAAQRVHVWVRRADLGVRDSLRDPDVRLCGRRVNGAPDEQR